LVNENESVQQQIQSAAHDDRFGLVALAAEPGFQFTSEHVGSVATTLTSPKADGCMTLCIVRLSDRNERRKLTSTAHSRPV